MFNIVCTFFYAHKVRADRKLRLYAQAAVQMLFRQTKNTNSFRSKNLQNKSSKFREIEKRATFLTLLGAQWFQFESIHRRARYALLRCSWGVRLHRQKPNCAKDAATKLKPLCILHRFSKNRFQLSSGCSSFICLLVVLSEWSLDLNACCNDIKKTFVELFASYILCHSAAMPPHMHKTGALDKTEELTKIRHLST